VEGAPRARLHTRYERLLADGQAANPPPPATGQQQGRARRSPAGRLLARLDAHRDEVLRCLDDLRVSLTNNQAERDLRISKQQKISGCWRTLVVAEAFLQCSFASTQTLDAKAGTLARRP
jgi:transposase